MSKRITLTRDGKKFDFSEPQFAMLTRKMITPDDPMEYNFEQRIKSLIKQGLFRKRNGAFERTKLGSVVVQIIHDRLVAKTSVTPKE